MRKKWGKLWESRIMSSFIWAVSTEGRNVGDCLQHYALSRWCVAATRLIIAANIALVEWQLLQCCCCFHNYCLISTPATATLTALTSLQCVVLYNYLILKKKIVFSELLHAFLFMISYASNRAQRFLCFTNACSEYFRNKHTFNPPENYFFKAATLVYFATRCCYCPCCSRCNICPPYA